MKLCCIKCGSYEINHSVSDGCDSQLKYLCGVCHWKTLAEIRLAYVGQLERNVNELKEMNNQLCDTNLKVSQERDECYGTGAQQRIDELTQELNSANELIIRLQNVTNNPHALWVNWVRGDVKLPEGIGDVREHQDHIRRMDDRIKRLEDDIASFANKHKEDQTLP